MSIQTYFTTKLSLKLELPVNFESDKLYEWRYPAFDRRRANMMLIQYSITEGRVPELIPVLGSQPAGDVSHKPDGRLLLLSARPAVTPATLKRAATNVAVW